MCDEHIIWKFSADYDDKIKSIAAGEKSTGYLFVDQNMGGEVLIIRPNTAIKCLSEEFGSKISSATVTNRHDMWLAQIVKKSNPRNTYKRGVEGYGRSKNIDLLILQSQALNSEDSFYATFKTDLGKYS